jgi:hypothetical protein
MLQPDISPGGPLAKIDSVDGDEQPVCWELINEMARLANLFTTRELNRIPLIDLRRTLRLEGVAIDNLGRCENDRAKLPVLAQLALREMRRRLGVV